MERFLQDEELYLTCLQTFAQDKGFAQIAPALAENNAEAAFDAVHTLKVVAANLGLTPLFKALCALTETLRRGTTQGTRPQLAEVLQAKEKYDEILAD